MSNISIVPVKDDGNLLQRLALSFHEKAVGDETLNHKDDHIDEVVFPADAVKSDRLQTVLAIVCRGKLLVDTHIDVLVDENSTLRAEDVSGHALGSD